MEHVPELYLYEEDPQSTYMREPKDFESKNELLPRQTIAPTT